MKKIQILGTGCPKCKKLAENAEAAAKDLGLESIGVKLGVPEPRSDVKRSPQRRQFEISANDKRFLRSLRIASDETQEKEVE